MKVVQAPGEASRKPLKMFLKHESLHFSFFSWLHSILLDTNHLTQLTQLNPAHKSKTHQLKGRLAIVSCCVISPG
jgi:hypothetical protein